MGLEKCCGQTTCSEDDVAPVNDKRCQLLNEIKQMLGEMEKGHSSHGQQRVSRREAAMPGMRKSLEEECRPYRKRRECTPPLITTIALHETRPTSDYSNMKYENSSQVTYVDATKEDIEWRCVPPAPWDLPRTPSQELRAGVLYVSCDCRKRNGLQYDCPRWECGGRPECIAVNPGPCCLPSQAPKPERGDRRYSAPPTGPCDDFPTDNKAQTVAFTGTSSNSQKEQKYDICIPKKQQPRTGPKGCETESEGMVAMGGLGAMGGMGGMGVMGGKGAMGGMGGNMMCCCTQSP